MIEIKRYTTEDKPIWDTFLDQSKNATFIFKRDYLDYHSDRFVDHSLLIFQKGKLVSLFVANEKNLEIIAHEGLTYGGLIMDKEIWQEDVLTIFYHLCNYYFQLGFKKCLYKAIPFYFSKSVAQEDLFPISLIGGLLTRRDTSFVVELKRQGPKISSRRMKEIREAEKNGIRVIQVDSPKEFWSDILVPNLIERFNSSPVHSMSEMNVLMQKFPANVLQFLAVYDSESVAGVTIFQNENVAHAQYTSATHKGKELLALDFLFYKLITETFCDKEYFSFGTSNGPQGNKINQGLTEWKQRFGARVFVHDFYEFNFSNYTRLSEYK